MATIDLHTWLDALAHNSATQGVSEELCSQVTRRTRRAMGEMAGRALTPAERRRCAAYFDAVLRRRMLRGAENRHFASRVVLDAVVADLAACGRDAAAIADELERGWSHHVSHELIEEYRLRLCS